MEKCIFPFDKNLDIGPNWKIQVNQNISSPKINCLWNSRASFGNWLPFVTAQFQVCFGFPMKVSHTFLLHGLLTKGIAKIVYHLILTYTKPVNSGAWWGLKWYLRASHSHSGEFWVWPRNSCPFLLPLHHYMGQMHPHHLAQELAHSLSCGHWKWWFSVLLLLRSTQREPRQKRLSACSPYLAV